MNLPLRPAIVASALAALALIAMAYWPGLSGPFLFDDFSNLDALGAFGPIDNWRTFLYYITSGTADPTGRPVALLTFLLDAQDWPADPWPFKRTNLLLHLANTILLALVVARLQAGMIRLRPDFPASPWTPLFAAFLWGAHPFFVSTTLYVVQREAMLPATFVLVAILAWDRAVLAMQDGRRAVAWTLIAIVGASTLLGGLSKANGFLAPLLVALAYLWCLRPAENRMAIDRAATVVLGVPTLLLFAYLAHYAVDLWSAPYLHGRDWTLPERVLSEPRAVWDYVYRLAVPRSGGGGLYVEDFAVSRGWLTPASTTPALLAMLASIVAAIAWRRRFPVPTLAWLFFLTAHLLESTVIALELYFEHRNYLPAMLLGWPVAHLLLKPAPHGRRRLLLAAVIAALLLSLTWQRANVWGNQALLTAVSAIHRDESIRSQVSAAHAQLRQGSTVQAIERMRRLQQEEPGSATVALNAIAVECIGNGRLSPVTLGRGQRALRVAKNWNFGLYTWLGDAVTNPATRDCQGFGLKGVRQLVAAALANPRNQGMLRRRDLAHVQGRIALGAGDPARALHWFNTALALQPDPNYALVQAAELGNAGSPAEGVAHLDGYRRMALERAVRIRDMRTLHRWLLAHTGYYREELVTLRARLAEDAGVEQGTGKAEFGISRGK